MRSSSSVYIPRIDHLRGVAMLLVFGWHVGHTNNVIPFAFVPKLFVLSILEEGHTGVSLFLTLSGFIFASLAEGKTVEYRPFIRNRLLRIAPLFVVWTLVLYFTQSQIAPERLLTDLLANRGDFPGAGWTILVEFQLYLVFPFLVLFRRRYGPKYLVGMLAVLFMLRLQSWLVVHNVQFLSYSTIIGRGDEFLLGMLASEASKRWGKQLGRSIVFFPTCIVWLLIMHGFNRLGGYYFSAANPIGNGLWVYFPTLEGFFYGLITASYVNLPLRGSALMGRFFTFLGMLSYSAYLNHLGVTQGCYFLGTLLHLPLDRPLWLLAFGAFVMFPAVIACSALTYYVIELPFLNMRQQYVHSTRERDVPSVVRSKAS